MIYAKFNNNGHIIEFATTEKDGYTAVPNLNCRLVNGSIVDETSRFLNKYKLKELENWFDNYFDKQLTQSMWQDDFAVSHDNYFDKNYANIDELKAQAEIVRQEIKRLKQNL